MLPWRQEGEVSAAWLELGVEASPPAAPGVWGWGWAERGGRRARGRRGSRLCWCRLKLCASWLADGTLTSASRAAVTYKTILSHPLIHRKSCRDAEGDSIQSKYLLKKLSTNTKRHKYSAHTHLISHRLADNIPAAKFPYLPCVKQTCVTVLKQGTKS